MITHVHRAAGGVGRLHTCHNDCDLGEETSGVVCGLLRMCKAERERFELEVLQSTYMRGPLATIIAWVRA